MNIQLYDKTAAYMYRFTDGMARVTFLSLRKSIVLPVGTVVTVALLNRLYAALAT